MTLRQKFRRHELTRQAYKLVCLKSDVEDIRSITAEYKATLLKIYLDWVYALAKALQKTQEPDVRKALIIGSIAELIGTLKTLGRKYLTKSFEVATGRESLRKKQWEIDWETEWEPDEDALDEILEESIAANDHYLAESLSPALLATAGGLFEEPEKFGTPTSIREPLMARAYQVSQYAAAAWALFWESSVESKSPDTYYAWRGTDDKDLCGGCRARLDQQYNKSTLPGFPGDGSTECEMGCRCWLEELPEFFPGYFLYGPEPAWPEGDPDLFGDPGSKERMTEEHRKLIEERFRQIAKDLGIPELENLQIWVAKSAGEWRQWTGLPGAFSKNVYGLYRFKYTDWPKGDMQILLPWRGGQELRRLLANPLLLNTREGVNTIHALFHEFLHGVSGCERTFGHLRWDWRDKRWQKGVYKVLGHLEEGLTEAVARDYLHSFLNYFVSREELLPLVGFSAYPDETQAVRFFMRSSLGDRYSSGRFAKVGLKWITTPYEQRFLDMANMSVTGFLKGGEGSDFYSASDTLAGEISDLLMKGKIFDARETLFEKGNLIRDQFGLELRPGDWISDPHPKAWKIIGKVKQIGDLWRGLLEKTVLSETEIIETAQQMNDLLMDSSPEDYRKAVWYFEGCALLLEDFRIQERGVQQS